MRSGSRSFLGREIDMVGERTAPIAPIRWIILGVLCSLICLRLGTAQLAPWILAFVISQAGLWMCTGPQRQGRASTDTERRVYFAAIVVANLVWCSFAAFLWMQDGAEFRVVALCLLTGQILHALVLTVRALPTVLVVGGFPSVTLLALVSLAGDFAPLPRLLMIGAVMTLIAFCIRVGRHTAQIEKTVEESRNQAVKANADKSSYLSFISHELRTPMNGVLGMAAALKLDELSQRQKEQIDVLIHSGENLVQLLNDILDLSKLEAGAFSLDEQPFGLASMAHDFDALWRPLAQKKGLEFSTVVDPALPDSIHGDARRLSQIINNLISNACKFTDTGSISVTLKKAGEMIEIAVVDTGCGMNPDEVARLFQPFAQVAGKRRLHAGGTGLGLFICLQLATALGGSIDVTSAVARGSTFTMSIPLRPARSVADRDQPLETDLRGIRVLIIEDNLTNQFVIRTLLEALGCVADIADDGVVGVQMAGRTRYDVILMDIYLPGLDGYEAFDLLRSSSGPSQSAPVIAFTAEVDPESIGNLRRHGFASIVTKPVEVRSLAWQIMLAVRDADGGAGSHH